MYTLEFLPFLKTSELEILYVRFSVFAQIALRELSGFTSQVRMIGKMVLIYAKLHRDVYFSGASQAKRVEWVASNSNP